VITNIKKHLNNYKF